MTIDWRYWWYSTVLTVSIIDDGDPVTDPWRLLLLTVVEVADDDHLFILICVLMVLWWNSGMVLKVVTDPLVIVVVDGIIEITVRRQWRIRNGGVAIDFGNCWSAVGIVLCYSVVSIENRCDHLLCLTVVVLCYWGRRRDDDSESNYWRAARREGRVSLLWRARQSLLNGDDGDGIDRLWYLTLLTTRWWRAMKLTVFSGSILLFPNRRLTVMTGIAEGWREADIEEETRSLQYCVIWPVWNDHSLLCIVTNPTHYCYLLVLLMKILCGRYCGVIGDEEIRQWYGWRRQLTLVTEGLTFDWLIIIWRLTWWPNRLFSRTAYSAMTKAWLTTGSVTGQCSWPAIQHWLLMTDWYYYR